MSYMATGRLKQIHCQAEFRWSTASVDDADHADTRGFKTNVHLVDLAGALFSRNAG